MLNQRKRTLWLAAICMYPFLVLLAIRFATFPGGNLMEFVSWSQAELMERPLQLSFCKNTIPVVLIVTCIYFFSFFVGITSMKNTRPGEEYGSAKWDSARNLNKKYRSQIKSDHPDMPAWRYNTIMTKGVKLGLDMYRHLKNLNVLIFGGSGAGKTRGFILPNIMQANSAMVITDPKGEILAKVGKLLGKLGYDIRVLDLKNHEKSHGYNPFRYFRNDNDILLFVQNMWGAMEDKTAVKGEQIWDDQAKAMLMSFMLYLNHFAPPEEQNFDTVMQLLHEVNVSEGPSKGPGTLDILFSRIPDTDTAYKYYKDWSAAKGRTLASIVSTLSARMSIFNLESIKQLTYHDEMDIRDLATKKVAIFMVIPDSNSAYNFLAGTLYTQLFQELYQMSDDVYDHGPLPNHVRFYMDEFANIALPDDYQKILSTARSRNLSFVIVLQNKQQIEAIYEKYWRVIIGNCDSLLFLGSSEYETCKYFSDLMDKETIHVYNWTKNYGVHGGVSRQEQTIGRELMLPGELRKLDNNKAVYILRGEDAVMDDKYNLKRHPYYAQIADGKNFEDNCFDWGTWEHAIGTLQAIDSHYSGVITALPQAGDWELLSPEEIDAMAG
jgi:type IV secretion system protein VirD4